MSEVDGKTFSKKIGAAVRRFQRTLLRLLESIKIHLAKFARHLKRSWKKFLRHFTKWIDPKLEPYRTHRDSAQYSLIKTASSPTELSASDDPDVEKDAISASTERERSSYPEQKPNTEISSHFEVPSSRADLFTIIGSTPFGILTKRERETITNVLSLPDHTIEEIMLPKSKVVYVQADEVLGPLTLDRLYRSGLAYFPVVDSKGRIIGTLHTAQLNSLEIREATRADQMLNPNIYYARLDYTLAQALDAFLRTSSQILIIVDHYGNIVGMLTFDEFCRAVFGQVQDGFDRDDDRLAVAKRCE